MDRMEEGTVLGEKSNAKKKEEKKTHPTLPTHNAAQLNPLSAYLRS